MVNALGRIEILEWAEIISKINADILKGILNTGMSKDIKKLRTYVKQPFVGYCANLSGLRYSR